jgi:hypothetical protein
VLQTHIIGVVCATVDNNSWNSEGRNHAGTAAETPRTPAAGNKSKPIPPMNADHELGIKIKITADTSGANAAARALEELKQPCDPAANTPSPDEPRPKDASGHRNDASSHSTETPGENARESERNKIVDPDPKEFPRELREAVAPPTTGQICNEEQGLGQPGTGGGPSPALEMQTRGNQFHDPGLPAPPRVSDEWLEQFKEFVDLHEQNMEKLMQIASRLAAGARGQGQRVSELERLVESLSSSFDRQRSFTATGS